jgi:L-rhamnose mutarotase
MKRYCYALDLVNDDKLIQKYISYHNQFWPEIQKSILDSGINLM